MADTEPVWGLPDDDDDDDGDGDTRPQTRASLTTASLGGASFVSATSDIDLVASANRPESVASAPSGGSLRTPRNVTSITKKDKLDMLILQTQKDAAEKKKKKKVRIVPHRGQAKDDFMKELLVGNARRRYRRKHRVPLEDRIQEFFERLEELKKKDREARDPKSLDDIRKRWTLLTKGVRAALAAESDDDEDHNAAHTLWFVSRPTLFDQIRGVRGPPFVQENAYFFFWGGGMPDPSPPTLYQSAGSAYEIYVLGLHNQLLSLYLIGRLDHVEKNPL